MSLITRAVMISRHLLCIFATILLILPICGKSQSSIPIRGDGVKPTPQTQNHDQQLSSILPSSIGSIGSLGSQLPQLPTTPPTSSSLTHSAVFSKGPYILYMGIPGTMDILYQLHQTFAAQLRHHIYIPEKQTSENTLDFKIGRDIGLDTHDTLLDPWGTSQGSPSVSVPTSEYNTWHQHRYQLTDLQPGVKYFFRVAIMNVVLAEGSFVGAPLPSKPTSDLQFLVYGDVRTHSRDHNMVAKAIYTAFTQNPALDTFLLSTGDYATAGDVESLWDTELFNAALWPDIYKMMSNIPYQGIRGNHEESGVYYRLFFPFPFVAPPACYWSWEYGPFHMIVLDPYTDFHAGSNQIKWLETDLATTQKKWKFVAIHTPGWAAGTHFNEPEMVKEQQLVHPLLVKYGVQAVWCGHNHNYALAIVNNVYYFTSGGGGAPLYPVNPHLPYVVKAVSTHNYLTVAIHGEFLRVDAFEVPSGKLLDTRLVQQSRGWRYQSYLGYPAHAGANRDYPAVFASDLALNTSTTNTTSTSNVTNATTANTTANTTSEGWLEGSTPLDICAPSFSSSQEPPNSTNGGEMLACGVLFGRTVELTDVNWAAENLALLITIVWLEATNSGASANEIANTLNATVFVNTQDINITSSNQTTDGSGGLTEIDLVDLPAEILISGTNLFIISFLFDLPSSSQSPIMFPAADSPPSSVAKKILNDGPVPIPLPPPGGFGAQMDAPRMPTPISPPKVSVDFILKP